jgi:hypothetical protein
MIYFIFRNALMPEGFLKVCITPNMITSESGVLQNISRERQIAR